MVAARGGDAPTPAGAGAAGSRAPTETASDWPGAAARGPRAGGPRAGRGALCRVRPRTRRPRIGRPIGFVCGRSNGGRARLRPRRRRSAPPVRAPRAEPPPPPAGRLAGNGRRTAGPSQLPPGFSVLRSEATPRAPAALAVTSAVDYLAGPPGAVCATASPEAAAAGRGFPSRLCGAGGREGRADERSAYGSLAASADRLRGAGSRWSIPRNRSRSAGVRSGREPRACTHRPCRRSQPGEAGFG